MHDFTRVLAIGAHPDDIEYGCLGWLLKMNADLKKHIFLGSMGSKGDPSTSESRLVESREALSVISPASVHVRPKAGIEGTDFNEVLEQLYGVIEAEQPELILTHSKHDTHQEHRLLHDISVAAARRSKATILSYGVLSNTLDFAPKLFIDVEPVYGQKKQALRKHKSQASKFYMQDLHLDIFHVHNYASLHGIRFCEAYEIVRMFG